jgi:uncharacterized protein (DUF2132 family)
MTQMTDVQPKNPLHGITLETILSDLVSRHGWTDLGRRIDIRCFNHEPSIASSLKFLRRTPWAREQVESLYLAGVQRKMIKQKSEAGLGESRSKPV